MAKMSVRIVEEWDSSERQRSTVQEARNNASCTTLPAIGELSIGCVHERVSDCHSRSGRSQARS